MSPSWPKSLKSHIWVFDTGRGLSVFIRTGLNQGIMYDFGSTEDFSPCEFLKKNIIPYLDKYKECKVAQTIISHPHADHISEIKQLLPTTQGKSAFYSSLHTCPHDKTPEGSTSENLDWDRIINPDGSDELVTAYKEIYKGRSLPLQTICYDSARSIPNLEYGLYYVRPPIVDKIHESNDNDYGNGTSLVIYYRHGIHTLLIPGDITPDALQCILNEEEGSEKRYTCFENTKTAKNPNWHVVSSNQPSLKSLLSTFGLSILIAPHHGLESGYSEDLYKSIKGGKPDIVIISEKKHETENDGTIDSRYQSEKGSTGINFKTDKGTEKRHSLNTANCGHILVVFEGTGGYPMISTSSDPEVLLKKLEK